MLIGRICKLLEIIKNPNVNQFDTELFKNVQLHKAIDKDSRQILHFGLPIERRLCNFYMTLHGGACSTLIDCLAGIHAFSVDPRFRLAISTNLSVDFYSSSKINQYLDIYTEVLSINDSLAFMVANLFVEGTQVAKGTQTLYFIDKSADSLAKFN